MLARKFTIILMFISLQLFGQVNLFNLPQGRNRMSVDFENYDNIVVIKMTLLDSIPIRLILDSGIEGIILTDRELVTELEPSCIRSFKLTAPGQTVTLQACITPVLKFNFGGLEPLSSNAILLQEDMFSLDAFIGVKVHGLIGLEKFRNLIVSINYDKNNLTLIRPEKYSPPPKSDIIPLNILRGRPYMTARVELDTKEIRDLWLMIDSGANHPLLLETDSTDSYKPLKSLKTTIGRGLGGDISGEFVRSGWFMIGNHRLDNIITSLSSEYISGNASSRNFRDGTIGSGALSRFRVTFDYPHSRLILEQGHKFNNPFDYNMSGIIFEAISTGFNIFKVSEVIYDSPAFHAGVIPDDVLISINGKAAFALSLGELNAMLSRHPGNPIILVISREGVQMTIKFKLRRLI